MTRWMGMLLTCVTVSLFFVQAQEPGVGKDDEADRLFKERLRVKNAIADEGEAALKNPDKKIPEEKLNKLSAEWKEIDGKYSKLPEEKRRELEAKYKNEIDATDKRFNKAGEAGIKDLPSTKGLDGKGESPEQIMERLEKNFEKAPKGLKKDDPDKGKDTVKTQDDIIKDLNELLKQKNDGGGGGGSSGSGNNSENGGSTGSTKNQNPKDPKGGDPKDPKRDPGKDGSKDGNGLGGKGKDGKQNANKMMDPWLVNLPPEKRQEMDAYAKEGFMLRYQDQLRQYYRIIAEQNRR